MGSWCERLIKLDLPRRAYSDFALERVFVCGPHFIGKSRILQKIIKEERECNVSDINYKALLAKRDRAYVMQYLDQQRVDNKIYEHSLLQLNINDIISNYMKFINREDSDGGRNDYDDGVNYNYGFNLHEDTLRQFIGNCKDLANSLTRITKNLIILIDTTANYFDTNAQYRNFLYLQVIAYLSIIPNLQNYTKFVVIYDPSACDPVLERYGIYHWLHEYTVPSPSNRNVSLTRPEMFESTARKLILDLHKHEVFSMDCLT